MCSPRSTILCRDGHLRHLPNIALVCKLTCCLGTFAAPWCVDSQNGRPPSHAVHGAGGLYSGYTPNLIRNSIISCSELVAYDVAKKEYRGLGIPDGPILHMMSGLSAGLVATMLGNPMDVVSTRIMVHKATGNHASMMQTCSAMLQKEGALAFYQGFVPNFARIGSFNVVLWMSYEQLCALLA